MAGHAAGQPRRGRGRLEARLLDRDRRPLRPARPTSCWRRSSGRPDRAPSRSHNRPATAGPSDRSSSSSSSVRAASPRAPRCAVRRRRRPGRSRRGAQRPGEPRPPKSLVSRPSPSRASGRAAIACAVHLSRPIRPCAIRSSISAFSRWASWPTVTAPVVEARPRGGVPGRRAPAGPPRLPDDLDAVDPVGAADIGIAGDAEAGQPAHRAAADRDAACRLGGDRAEPQIGARRRRARARRCRHGEREASPRPSVGRRDGAGEGRAGQSGLAGERRRPARRTRPQPRSARPSSAPARNRPRRRRPTRPAAAAPARRRRRSRPRPSPIPRDG